MGILDALEGVLKERLRFGRWVSAEGAVYHFDRRIHIVTHMPEGWETWRKGRVIDFGFENPFVCLWGALDGDGRLYIYRQLYMSHHTVDEHAETIRRAERWYLTADDYTRQAAAALKAGELAKFDERYTLDDAGYWMIDRRTGKGVPNPAREKIEISIADHDAEGRATLHKEGIATVPAKKDVLDGIQAVQKRLRKAKADNRPRLYILENCLIERDEQLAAKYHPTSIEGEFDVYVWPKAADGKPVKEAPVKMFDHAMDSLRYFCYALDRFTPIIR
jgi:phage terminase large subunit